MSIIRPEVLAFIRAAQGLFSIEAQETSLPLSDDETEKIVECTTKLEKVPQDGDCTRVDGDGQTAMPPIPRLTPHPQTGRYYRETWMDSLKFRHVLL